MLCNPLPTLSCQEPPIQVLTYLTTGPIRALQTLPLLDQLEGGSIERTCDTYSNNVAIRMFIILVYFICNYFQSIKVIL